MNPYFKNNLKNSLLEEMKGKKCDVEGAGVLGAGAGGGWGKGEGGGGGGGGWVGKRGGCGVVLEITESSHGLFLYFSYNI